MSTRKVSKSIRKLVPSVSLLRTNKQKVLATLLTAPTTWVTRSQFAGINSATARIRELRQDGFEVECSSDPSLVRRLPEDQRKGRPTFYRLNPLSVTAERVQKVLSTVKSPVRG